MCIAWSVEQMHELICVYFTNKYRHSYYPRYVLLLADNWLAVMTGHIIEARGSLDDDGETVLVTLGIVRLTRAPPVLGGGPTTGPGDASGSVVDSTSGPEVGLALPHQETGELPLLVRAVQ